MHRRHALALLGSACLAPAFALPGAAQATRTERVIDRGAIADTIGKRTAAFVALDGETNEAFLLDPAGADTRHPPFSTFKIPNLLIALETGAARGLDHQITWDPARRPAASYWPKEWRQDQTLATAFTRSAAWSFQDLALRIGAARYREDLRRFGYGDANVPDGSDSFWLDDPDPARRLTVSPREQAAFLLAAIEGRLGLRPETLAALDKVAALKAKDGVTLYGKTGAGPLRPGDYDGAFQGWLAGYVRRPQKRPVSYALYVTGPSFSSIRQFRQDMSEALLRQIGVLPAGW